MKTCPDCNGDGVVEKGTDDEQQCPTCGGSGFVPDDDDGQEEVIHTRQPNWVHVRYWHLAKYPNFAIDVAIRGKADIARALGNVCL